MEEFWIGKDLMEPFKLWLASEITVLSYRAKDKYLSNEVKKVLNSLGGAYLNKQSETWYSLFVSELIEELEKKEE